MNHMVAHKNDRPHICNLCGARYIRKLDLLNHLKVHAQMPDTDMEYADLLLREDKEEEESEQDLLIPSKRNPRQRKKSSPIASVKTKKDVKTSKKPAAGKTKYTDELDELLGAAQQHENYYEQNSSPSVSHNRFAITDPERPFVCQVCGVSFAREKALSSHFLMHDVDNALECESCNEVFWSVESLQEHQNLHHSRGSSGSEYEPDKNASDDDSDSKFGDFYCNVCGMSFHRLDLLKRHSRTHSQLEVQKNNATSSEKHCCTVCKRTFSEALDLLAHAEMHARVVSFK